MVSLARAAECIGRPVKHTTQPLVQGVVSKVDERDVWVRLERGSESLPCIPEHLEWDQRGYAPIIEALVDGVEYRDAQAWLAWDDYGDIFTIGSSDTANDDDRDHVLYVGIEGLRRIHRARITADPWVAYSYEEALGWAQP